MFGITTTEHKSSNGQVHSGPRAGKKGREQIAQGRELLLIEQS